MFLVARRIDAECVRKLGGEERSMEKSRAWRSDGRASDIETDHLSVS